MRLHALLANRSGAIAGNSGSNSRLGDCFDIRAGVAVGAAVVAVDNAANALRLLTCTNPLRRICIAGEVSAFSMRS
jgi:hypothetical protein